MPDWSEDQELRRLAGEVKNYLDYLDSLGVQRLPRIEERPAAGGGETLDQVRADLGECTRCPLCSSRTNIVFGEGPENTGLFFVGEGPGRDEDEAGRPFVGRAGELLTAIIEKGMKLNRDGCYISNIVKCRPPNNRDPLPNEARTCLPFLHRQISVIRPVVIVALGRVAAQYLLDTDQPLGKLRNRFHDLNGTPVMPTYHPAAVLRDQRRKRDVWDDIKLVMARLSEENPD